MRVIEKGIEPHKLVHRVRCGKCRSLFEFAASEARLTFDQRDGDYYVLKCPVCKEQCSSAVSNGRLPAEAYDSVPPSNWPFPTDRPVPVFPPGCRGIADLQILPLAEIQSLASVTSAVGTMHAPPR